MGLKYEKLTEQLIKNSYEKVELSYDELEKILGGELPKTMIKNGLTLKSKIGRSILNGGFIVKSNSAKKKKLILEKNEKLSKKRLNNITPCPKDEINKKIFLNVIFPKGAKYLNSLENIGHEIIDIFGGDNGEYHYYLNPYGLVDKNNIPNYIISISSVSKRVYKILNLAVVEKEEEDSISKKTDCNDLYEKQKEKFKYNNIFLENYFKDNHSGNTLLSSFRCEGIYEPANPLYITFNLQGKRDNFLNLISTNPGRTTNFKVFNKEDQKKLEKLVQDATKWNEKPIKSFKEYCEKYKNKSSFSYFKELGIEEQELQYSNAIRFFLNDEEKINKFLKGIGCKINKGEKFYVERENYNIDLLLNNFNILKDPINIDNEKIVIIENKLKANITPTDNDKTLKGQVEKIYKYVYGLSDDKKFDNENKNKLNDICNYLDIDKADGKIPSQLSKYYIYAVILAKKRNWNDAQINENIKCFFLCPEYSKHLYDLSPDGYLNNNKYVEGNDILFLQEKYKLITYKDILEIFKKLINKNTKDKFNILLEDFIEALSIHAKDRDDSLEQKMIELFYNRSKNS